MEKKTISSDQKESELLIKELLGFSEKICNAFDGFRQSIACFNDQLVIPQSILLPIIESNNFDKKIKDKLEEANNFIIEISKGQNKMCEDATKGCASYFEELKSFKKRNKVILFCKEGDFQSCVLANNEKQLLALKGQNRELNKKLDESIMELNQEINKLKGENADLNRDLISKKNDNAIYKNNIAIFQNFIKGLCEGVTYENLESSRKDWLTRITSLKEQDLRKIKYFKEDIDEELIRIEREKMKDEIRDFRNKLDKSEKELNKLREEAKELNKEINFYDKNNKMLREELEKKDRIIEEKEKEKATFQRATVILPKKHKGYDIENINKDLEELIKLHTDFNKKLLKTII